MGAPTHLNPYRQGEDGEHRHVMGEMLLGHRDVPPPPLDLERGAGLTGADLDRIARDNYRRGWETRAVMAREEENALRNALMEERAGLFDEGYDIGDDVARRRVSSEVLDLLNRVRLILDGEVATDVKRRDRITSAVAVIDEVTAEIDAARDRQNAEA